MSQNKVIMVNENGHIGDKYIKKPTLIEEVSKTSFEKFVTNVIKGRQSMHTLTITLQAKETF